MQHPKIDNNDADLSELLLTVTSDDEHRQQQQLPYSLTTTTIPVSSEVLFGDIVLPHDNDDHLSSSVVLLSQQQQRDEPLPAQQPEYRDTPFAVGFLGHILIILYLAFGYGISSMTKGRSNQYDDDSDNNRLSGILWLCIWTSWISIGISVLSLRIMTYHAELLIQSSLIGSCSMMVFFVIVFLTKKMMGMAVLWWILLLVTTFYAKSCWNRIPFAASNLRTALSAIQTNSGVCILAYGIALLANLWVLLWLLAFIGVTFTGSSCDDADENDGACSDQPYNNNNKHVLSILFLIVSYHWTSQVLKNLLHVTVSGVVGTWWFAPQDALSVFSPAIMDSFRRAITYSFGSICMGSLLVAIVQTLQCLVRSVRRNNRCPGLLLCILECILQFLSRIAIYFNKWAYVYVGLYGYDYLTAGKKVLELFEERGWTTIINDNLVHRTLALVSVVIGALSGLVGILLAKATGWTTAAVALGGDKSDSVVVFVICFVIGVSMAYILMGVVLSAVDTVIVSFAEAPTEFQASHPALSQNMIQKWREVYPNECDF